MSEWSDKVNSTKLRHENMSCKTFEIKIDKSHLSTEKLNYLNMLFVEAKWLYNYILSTEKIFDFDTKVNEVNVLNKDKELETRNLVHLSSQMKQSIQQRLENAVKSLSTRKKNLKNKKKKTKRDRIGRIKFTSNVESITLNQYNITYRIKDNKYLILQTPNYHKKYKIKIEGYNQIPKDSEITCSTLIHRHDDFYLKITCFVPKEIIEPKQESIGIDFGLETTAVLRDGHYENLKIKENKRLRKVSRRLHKKTKGSKNYIKQKKLLNKEYHKLTNKKKDKKNKIVKKIISNYKIVIVQDENTEGWKTSGYGKSVQQSLISGIIRDLQRKSHTFVKVDRFFPSTKLCPVCGNKQEMPVDVRTYKCRTCGYEEDRDVKSALCIEIEGLRQLAKEVSEEESKRLLDIVKRLVDDCKIPVEHRKLTLVEMTPLLNQDVFGEQGLSVKQEASAFRQR